MAINGYTAAKVFSATISKERETLGDKLSAWLQAHPGVEVVDTAPLQSSDNAFHCITIVVFYRESAAAAGAKAA